MANPCLTTSLLLLASTLCMSHPSPHQPLPRALADHGDVSKTPATNTETPPADASNNTQPQRISKISKRSYYPSAYSNYIPPQPFQSIAVWKPPVYQLSRPYYVPIFGAPGRVPLYYPPQPLYLNPGMPQVNPLPPNYMGPTYLPPVTPPTPDETTMRLDNRFNNENDDKPIWDVVNSDSQSPNTVPTRPPKKPGSQSTTPPLVHNGGAVAPPPPPNSRPAGEGSSNQRPNRPEASRPQQTTPAPSGPSKCVWAIISCCSATSEIRYNCFEQLGCRGAFWDRSPCEGEFAEAAIQQALNYYNP